MVLTTTANAEDALLIIKMKNSNSNQKEEKEDDSPSIKDISLAITEFETFDTEHATDIDDTSVIEYQEASIMEHYDLEDYDITRVQVLNDQCQREKSNITEDFKFTLKIDFQEDPILDETNVDSYFNINDDDDDDDDYTYTYEEVTDSEYEYE